MSYMLFFFTMSQYLSCFYFKSYMEISYRVFLVGKTKPFSLIPYSSRIEETKTELPSTNFNTLVFYSFTFFFAQTCTCELCFSINFFFFLSFWKEGFGFIKQKQAQLERLEWKFCQANLCRTPFQSHTENYLCSGHSRLYSIRCIYRGRMLMEGMVRF